MAAMIARHDRTGQAWKFRGQLCTYCPGRREKYVSLHRLKPSSEEQFWNLMQRAEALGFDPPKSYPDIIDSLWPKRPPQKTVVATYYGRVTGAWAAALRRGVHQGTYYYYDLRQAYRWAAEQGLPDLWQARGSRDLSDAPACWLVELPANRVPYHPGGGLRLWTSEEQVHTPLEGVTVLGGWRWPVAWLDPSPIFAWIEREWPDVLKPIVHTFSGRWNSLETATCHSWGGGHAAEKIRSLPPCFYNPVWAHYTYSRVKLRLLEHAPDALVVQSDAVLVPYALPEGDRPGDWHGEGAYRDVHVKATGNWDHAGGRGRHAGVRV